MKPFLRSCFDNASNFLKSNLGTQVLFYTFFYLILWLFHLLLISLISYFHLLLNHNIRIIGDWIGDRGWIIIILSKVSVFYLAMLFFGLKTKKINSLKSYLRNSIQIPRLEVIVSLLFLIIGIIGLGNIQYNKTMILELDRLIYSIVGTILFFGIDFAFLIIIDIFYPARTPWDIRKRFIIFPLLFYFFSLSTFIYEQTISMNHFVFFFLLIYSGEWRRRNWTIPALFLGLFIVPAYALMGFDPVWADLYSPFVATSKVSSFSFLTLVAFCIGYLQYTQKKKPEYIYRD